MKLIDQARRAGTTLAIACLAAGATIAAGALILGLGTTPTFARQAGMPTAAATLPALDHGLPMSGFGVTQDDTETTPRAIEDARGM